MNFVVTEKAQRPARMDGRCFYCGQHIGSEHLADCVLVKKRVKVVLVVEYEIEVPNHWGAEMIEFHRNEGSWCADNLLGELEELSEREGCLCHVATFACASDQGEAFLNEDGT